MKVATVFALLLVSASAFTAPQFATRAVGAPKKKAAPKKKVAAKKPAAKKPIMTKIKSARVRSVEFCCRNEDDRFITSCVFYGFLCSFSYRHCSFFSMSLCESFANGSVGLRCVLSDEPGNT